MDGDGREREPTTYDALVAWRAASRELDHATRSLRSALSRGSRETAEPAEQDITETDRAAADAADASEMSGQARAESAPMVRQPAEADVDLAEARATVDAATSAEFDARERHHEVQGRAFERYGYGTDTGLDLESDAGSSR